MSLEDIPVFLEILADIDDYEASLYYEIIQDRLSIISKLLNLVDENVLEKTLQEYLGDHLWLLDPSWDRTIEVPSLEYTVKKEFDDVSADLTPEEKRGRVDIKYKKTSGKHVIIELKRADRILTENELETQVLKYKSALQKALNNANETDPIEVVCIVGNPL